MPSLSCWVQLFCWPSARFHSKSSADSDICALLEPNGIETFPLSSLVFHLTFVLIPDVCLCTQRGRFQDMTCAWSFLFPLFQFIAFESCFLVSHGWIYRQFWTGEMVTGRSLCLCQVHSPENHWSGGIWKNKTDSWPNYNICLRICIQLSTANDLQCLSWTFLKSEGKMWRNKELEVAEIWNVWKYKCVLGKNDLFWKELSFTYQVFRNPVSKEVRAECVLMCHCYRRCVCKVDVWVIAGTSCICIYIQRWLLSPLLLRFCNTLRWTSTHMRPVSQKLSQEYQTIFCYAHGGLWLKINDPLSLHGEKRRGELSVTMLHCKTSTCFLLKKKRNSFIY